MARNSLIPTTFGASDPILSLHREMNRMFDDVFRGSFARPSGASSQAAQPTFFNASMNVSETGNELRVSVELPGVNEQDVDISLNDDLLTIRGEKKFESERGGGDNQRGGGEKENYHYVERSYGVFERSLRLPFQVNADEVRASFENGVLTITVPKSAQQERSRRIQIQGSGQGRAQMGQNGDQRPMDEIADRSGAYADRSADQDGGDAQQGQPH